MLFATGSLVQEATIFYKHLKLLLAIKYNDEYCKMIRCWLSLSLMRSAFARAVFVVHTLRLEGSNFS